MADWWLKNPDLVTLGDSVWNPSQGSCKRYMLRVPIHPRLILIDISLKFKPLAPEVFKRVGNVFMRHLNRISLKSSGRKCFPHARGRKARPYCAAVLTWKDFFQFVCRKKLLSFQCIHSKQARITWSALICWENFVCWAKKRLKTQGSLHNWHDLRAPYSQLRMSDKPSVFT